jgi:recombination protein RecR
VAERVAGPEIERLIQLLARLPGLGPRSARRAALHLIRKRDDLLGPLADAMATARATIKTCATCGNIDTLDPCSICRDPRRDAQVLIVVETVADLWALERAAALRARYHVLGGTLSPLDGIGPGDLNLATLVGRVMEDAIAEVILAVRHDRPSRGQDHPARPWRSSWRRTRLSRRRDSVGGPAQPHRFLTPALQDLKRPLTAWRKASARRSSTSPSRHSRPAASALAATARSP